MARRVAPVLADMLEAISGIEAAVKDMDFTTFRNHWTVRHAVQRGIEIISEAARRLPDDLLAEYTDLPWKEIKGVGNILRHEYHRVSDQIIWTTVQDELPRLKTAVQQMLDKAE